jgi:hypothetical protein
MDMEKILLMTNKIGILILDWLIREF